MRPEPPVPAEAFACLSATLDAATAFGLTAEEAWEAAKRTLVAAPWEPTAPECLDEVAGALALEVVEKQRRLFRERLRDT